MELVEINLGSAPNDGTGDSPRAAGQKINGNFAEVAAKFLQQDGHIEEQLGEQSNVVEAFVETAGAQVAAMLAALAGGQFPAGTLAGPSISFTLDPDTGFYRPAADTIALVAGGVERWRATPIAMQFKAHAPNTNPLEVLSPTGVVIASLRAAGTPSRGVFRLFDSAGAQTLELDPAGNSYLLGGNLLLGTATQSGNARLTVNGQISAGAGSAAVPSITFAIDNTAGFYQDTGGVIRVAIGNLRIAGFGSSGLQLLAGVTSAGSPSLSFDGSGTTGIFHPSSGVIAFSRNGVESARIDNVGNVRIGSAVASSYRLDVQQASGDTHLRVFSGSAGRCGLTLQAPLSTYNYIVSTDGNTQQWKLGDAGMPSQTLPFIAGTTLRMVLGEGLYVGSTFTDPGAGNLRVEGKVGVGKTPSAEVDVVGAVVASTYVKPGSFTFATLPSAAAAGDGARATMTDASAPVWGQPAVGGGAVKVPVYVDSGTWKVG